VKCRKRRATCRRRYSDKFRRSWRQVNNVTRWQVHEKK